jgi:hypothetical protein
VRRRRTDIMSNNQRIKAILTGVFVVLSLVVASCGPLAARVDTGEGEAVVGVRHGMELSLDAVPPTGVPVLCHGQAPAGVASIELYVNGMFVGRASNTAGPGSHEFNYFTAEMSFEPDGPGAYELRCRTQDHEGRSINSADVTIFLIGEAVPSPPPEVPTATPTETEVPQEVPTATPTSTGVPTHTPTSTAVPTNTPTATASSTPTTQPRVVITMFEADKTQITSGDCVRFTWQVEAPTAIYFDGEGVGNYPDYRDRCPTSTRSFELRAEGAGGPDIESITIVVTPGDTDGPSIGRVGHSPGLIYWDQYDTCDPIEVGITAYNITDPSGVSAVKVAYRVVEVNRPAGQWQAKSMNQVQTGTYSASIGPNDLELSLNPPVSYGYGNTSTLQYYIQAFDSLGNRSDSSTRTLTVEYCFPAPK